MNDQTNNRKRKANSCCACFGYFAMAIVGLSGFCSGPLLGKIWYAQAVENTYIFDKASYITNSTSKKLKFNLYEKLEFCSYKDESSINCTCKQKFLSYSCELFYKCTENVCQFGSTCKQKQMNKDEYKCICVSGAIGHNCETNVNECSSNPCKRNGTCKDFINHFICACLNGATGVYCETDVDECAEKPCKNGGICVENVLGSYYCYCPPNFSGNNCTISEGSLFSRAFSQRATSINLNMTAYFLYANSKSIIYLKESSNGTVLCVKELYQSLSLREYSMNLITFSNQTIDSSFSKWHQSLVVCANSTLYLLELNNQNVPLVSKSTHYTFQAVLAVKNFFVLISKWNTNFLIWKETEIYTSSLKKLENFTKVWLLQNSDFDSFTAVYSTETSLVGKEYYINGESNTKFNVKHQDETDIKMTKTVLTSSYSDVKYFYRDAENNLVEISQSVEVNAGISFTVHDQSKRNNYVTEATM